MHKQSRTSLPYVPKHIQQTLESTSVDCASRLFFESDPDDASALRFTPAVTPPASAVKIAQMIVDILPGILQDILSGVLPQMPMKRTKAGFFQMLQQHLSQPLSSLSTRNLIVMRMSLQKYADSTKEKENSIAVLILSLTSMVKSVFVPFV